MQIKNRQQFLIILVIAAGVLLVGVDYVYTPLANWWTARGVQIKNLREQVSEGKALIKRDGIVRGQWAEMQTNALPANTSQAEQQLFRAFSDWSRSSGAEISTISPQWQNTSTNYMTLDCRVETAGDINSLSKFLYAIENSPMPLQIESAELDAHDNLGQVLTLSLEINGLALTLTPTP